MADHCDFNDKALTDEDILEALGNTSDYSDDSDEDPTWTPHEKKKRFKIPKSRLPLLFEDLFEDELLAEENKINEQEEETAEEEVETAEEEVETAEEEVKTAEEEVETVEEEVDTAEEEVKTAEEEVETAEEEALGMEIEDVIAEEVVTTEREEVAVTAKEKVVVNKEKVVTKKKKVVANKKKGAAAEAIRKKITENKKQGKRSQGKTPKKKTEKPKKSTQKKQKPPPDPNTVFKKRPFPTPELNINHNQPGEQNEADQQEVEMENAPSPDRTPIEYLDEYFDEEFYENLAINSACYYMAQTGRDLKTSASEFKTFIGINLYMGCIKYPRINMYWQRKLSISAISDCMIRDRFSTLRNSMHVIDANTVSDDTKRGNKLWKIQPIIDVVRNKCLSLPRDSNKYSIDEQMVPFTGRCPVRQYVRNKPRPVGLKNFVLTTNEGIVLDFEVYQGKTTRLNNPELGLGPSVILRLVETVPQGSQVFFDRYFSSVPLFVALSEKGVHGTGTIMRNRLSKDTIDLGDVQNLKRGEFAEFTRNDEKVCVTAWMDSGAVLMASSYYGGQPVSQVKRWDLKSKREIEVTCPAVVKEYNSSMGGVDICDQMLEYYRTFFKTKKWTVKAIIHFIDLAVVNSWLTYRKDCRNNQKKRSETMDLLDFRLAIAEKLTASKPKRLSQRLLNEDPDEHEENTDMEPAQKKRYVPVPQSDKRMDGYNHFPVVQKIPNAMRCRNEGCKQKSRVMCEKCKVFLCLTAEKHCFKLFHVKK